MSTAGYLRTLCTIEADTLTDGTVVYLAHDPARPGCMSHGATPDEAAEMLEDARALYDAHVGPPAEPVLTFTTPVNGITVSVAVHP